MKTLIPLFLALLLPSANRADVVFLADLEDGEAAAQVGEILFRNDPVRRVDQTSSPDPKLGDHVLLIDRETDQEYALSFTIELSSPIDLRGAGASFSYH